MSRKGIERKRGGRVDFGIDRVAGRFIVLIDRRGDPRGYFDNLTKEQAADMVKRYAKAGPTRDAVILSFLLDLDPAA